MYKAFVRAKSGCDKWHDYEMSVAPYETDKPIYYEFTACPADVYKRQVENMELKGMVKKADGGSIKTVELTQKYTDASVHTYTPDWSRCV